MLTKENSGDGTGATSAGSACTKEKQNGHCNICGQNLIELNSFARYIIHVCDNIYCNCFASPQRYTKKPEAATPETKPHIVCTKPSYSHYLDQKKENYHLLRSHGLSSYEAMAMCSNKQTRYFLEGIGHEKSN